jgi:drug/metabolite transporter (DMT)-like permease
MTERKAAPDGGPDLRARVRALGHQPGGAGSRAKTTVASRLALGAAVLVARGAGRYRSVRRYLQGSAAERCSVPICAFVGLQFTTASRMVVFIYLAPFVVALGMPFIALERLTALLLAGLIAAPGVAWAFAETRCH